MYEIKEDNKKKPIIVNEKSIKNANVQLKFFSKYYIEQSYVSSQSK